MESEKVLRLTEIKKHIKAKKGVDLKEELQALDFAIELLELIEKWGLEEYSIKELDDWRDRMVQHVKWVSEFDADRQNHAKEELCKLQKKLDIEFNNARKSMMDNRQKLGSVEAVINMIEDARVELEGKDE